MAWQAIIRSKEIKDNILTVIVDASDGISKFSQAFSTSAPQSDTWIDDQISSTFTSVEALRTYADTIPVGKVISGK